MRYDVLHDCDGRWRHFCTVYANDDDQARRLVAEKGAEPDLRLRIVRVDGDRVTIVSRRREG